MALRDSNHYDVLGVGAGASATELRRAYLDRARRWHPDAGGDAESMRRLNEAWTVLGDPIRRRSYDVEHGTAAAGGEGDGPRSGHGRRFHHGTIGEELDADLLADLADDRPLALPSERSRVLTMVPVLFFAAAVGSAGAGVVLAIDHLIGLGAMLLFLSVLFMVAMPFLELARSRHR